MHVYFICVEAILLGAPYAFPQIPPMLGQIMFWAGVAVLFLYPVWQARGWITARQSPQMIWATLLIVGGSVALITGIVWAASSWTDGIGAQKTKAHTIVPPDLPMGLVFLGPHVDFLVRERDGEPTQVFIHVYLSFENTTSKHLKYEISEFEYKFGEVVEPGSLLTNGAIIARGKTGTFRFPGSQKIDASPAIFVGRMSYTVFYGPIDSDLSYWEKRDMEVRFARTKRDDPAYDVVNYINISHTHGPRNGTFNAATN